MAGLLLGVLYFYYYKEGDTLLYNRRGLWGAALLDKYGLQAYLEYLFLDTVPQQSPLAGVQVPYYSSAWNTVKLVSIPLALTGGNYFFSTLYLSLFSFGGMWFLVNKLSTHFSGTTEAAVLAFLFFPSVVFWSSGVLKESFIMGGMGLCVGGFLELYRPQNLQHRIKYFILALSGALVMWYVKYFVAIAVVAFLLLAFILRILCKSETVGRLNIYLKSGMGVLLFAGVVLIASQLNYNLNFSQLPVSVYENYLKYSVVPEGKPGIYLPALEPTYLSFALHAPLAFFGILLKPFIWEVYNPLTLVAAAENTFLLLLLLLACKDAIHKRIKPGQDWHLLLAALFYIVVMGVLLAFSMPNLGTLSRYRIVFLPFLLYLLLSSTSARHFLSHFKISKK
ncbi:hypothetical protein [Pontibacter beigongshangensis]|uniref:hypothetical protein n=1 Tax=Pontibacter beigongshangensis TaxID=2574733 RepID=UPI00164F49C4|nr:hypothetical protein [Pontibacter beigongshangensis]